MKIYLLLIFLLITSCNIHNNEYNLERNITAIIININGNEEIISSGKSKIPTLCNKVLFKDLNTKLYFTFSNCETIYHSIKLNDEWIYNHNINDTVHFDYIKKSRMFNIKNK